MDDSPHTLDRRGFVAWGAAAAASAAGIAASTPLRAQEPTPPRPAQTPPVRQDPPVRPGARGSLAREEDPRQQIAEAVCVLQPTSGSGVSGWVRFSRRERRQVAVRGELRGLEPGQVHALQIHEFGDLRDGQGAALGELYQPPRTEDDAAGAPTSKPGDLGVATADESGRAVFELVLESLTLNGRRHPVLGRSIVVHTAKGNVAARLAQGVIGIANPAWKPA
jgi:Cu/Zn superoxide dismutase